MKERPILFSAPMVRAILDGTKTVTRRIVRLPSDTTDVVIDPGGTAVFGPGPYIKARREPTSDNDATMHPRICSPYGYAGDRLWVKETHQIVPLHEGVACVYRASCDGDSFDCVDEDGCIQRLKVEQWKPSIFMRREYSRLALEIVSVRVERLHDITEEDARAEGVEPLITTRAVYPSKHADRVEHHSYRDGFAELWDAINGDRALWSSNPWVWRVEFKRLAQEAKAA